MVPEMVEITNDMSVIGLKGENVNWSFLTIVKKIAKYVSGPFHLLISIPKRTTWTYYMRLSRGLDPATIVTSINSGFGAKGIIAFIPEDLPEIFCMRKLIVPMNIRLRNFIPEFELPHEVITNTHYELFAEIQYKFPGLYNLSNKTGHRLLDELALEIGERLKKIMDTNQNMGDSSLLLSGCYRNMYPHYRDYQLIMSVLHRLQDANGAPRKLIKESKLTASVKKPYGLCNLPLDTVKTICDEYNKRIGDAITAHVTALDSEPASNDTEEDTVRKNVRMEIKKILRHTPKELSKIVSSYFIPEEKTFRRVRLYGEPYLPISEVVRPYTRQYNKNGSRALRSFRMYNLIQFKVTTEHFDALLATDGTVVNGARLTVRSEGPMREISPELRNELAAHFGGTGDQPAVIDETAERMDFGINWEDVIMS